MTWYSYNGGIIDDIDHVDVVGRNVVVVVNGLQNDCVSAGGEFPYIAHTFFLTTLKESTGGWLHSTRMFAGSLAHILKMSERCLETGSVRSKNSLSKGYVRAKEHDVAENWHNSIIYHLKDDKNHEDKEFSIYLRNKSLRHFQDSK